MYIDGSLECLRNAESLANDAEMLINNHSFAVAQSLSVIALEEASKALILGLSDLDYVKKDVVEIAMRKHPLKKIVLVGIEQSRLLLGDELIHKAEEFVHDEASLKELGKEWIDEIQQLEKSRQNGFYVDVNAENGTIKNSPRRAEPEDAQSLLNRARVFLQLAKILCQLFSRIKRGALTSVKIKEVRIPRSMWTGDTHLGTQPDYTLAIVFDEI